MGPVIPSYLKGKADNSNCIQNSQQAIASDFSLTANKAFPVSVFFFFNEV